VQVYLDGRVVDASRARVSVFDRGILFGDGVFESMRALHGRVFRLDRHLARLRQSAALIDLTLPLSEDACRAAIDWVLRANDLRDARLRLTVTRGPGCPGDYVATTGPPTTVITAAPFRPLDPNLQRRGVPVVISSRRVIPAAAIDPAIKSISRLASVLARREASQSGAFEALMLNADGCLVEGTASNLFLVAEGALSTPALAEGGLQGVTREAVLELADQAGLHTVEERVPAVRLATATEAFLTNTSWGVLPIATVDGQPIGGGSSGPVGRMLLQAYHALLMRETGSE
jgi:branched-chain amino acid aminotransferase